MTEIIYLDIDGTLRDEQSGIPDSAVQAIRQCRARGIRIVICTGRNPGSIQEDVKALPTDGVISGGGCYITYRGKQLQKKHFSDHLLKHMLLLASEQHLSLALEGEYRIYMDQNASAFYQEDFQRKLDQKSEEQKRHILLQNKIAYQNNFQELQKESLPIHKVCVFGEKDAIDRAGKMLTPRTEQVQKKEWNGKWYLELLPKGCSKGTAVTWLNHRLGIPAEHSMSFGDSENDIPMMQATGIAVAVGHKNFLKGTPVSSVCESVTEDGIYNELVRRKLIEPVILERRAPNE